MIKRAKNKYELNAIVFILALLTTVLGYLFTSNTSIVTVIYPITGFSIAVLSMYKRKILPSLLLGVFVGTAGSRYIIFDETIVEVILVSVSLSVVLLIQSLFFRYAMNKTESYGKITALTIVFYMLIVFFTSLIGAALASTTLSFIYGFNQFSVLITRWFIADLMGILIFGTTMLSSYFFDEKLFEKKNSIASLILILVFTFLSFIIFASTFGHEDIHQFYFIFLLIFFLAAYLFSYRMILVLSIIFIISYRIFYIWTGTIDFNIIALDLNMYLFTISMISQVLRMVLYSLEDNNKNLMETNEKLENLISSTTQLISIQQLKGNEQESNLEYVKRIFRIALSLYDSFELASCYIKVDDKPVFIDALGYDIDMINAIDFSNHFHWALQKPEHIVRPENDLKERLGEDYKVYNNTIPELKESIRFGIYIDELNCGGMSFDISRTSSKSFTKSDFDNFHSFQKLMNSLYEINYLNNKNITLKNDIVMSLIKTLELYDHYTGGHSQEVAILSKKVAIKMNLSEQRIYDIYWAGIVHDIGKIGISYKILNKKGHLTENEYDTVKLHPIFGSEILYQSEDLSSIAEIVKHHHEKWDGSGYPSRLKGQGIPIGAQILCISDAVSAMHGKRPYADTKSKEEIISELLACAGTCFNPILVPIMVEIIQNGALEQLKDEVI